MPLPNSETKFARVARVASFVITLFLVSIIGLLYTQFIGIIFNEENMALNQGSFLYTSLNFVFKLSGLASFISIALSCGWYAFGKRKKAWWSLGLAFGLLFASMLGIWLWWQVYIWTNS